MVITIAVEQRTAHYDVRCGGNQQDDVVQVLDKHFLNFNGGVYGRPLVIELRFRLQNYDKFPKQGVQKLEMVYKNLKLGVHFLRICTPFFGFFRTFL